MPIDTSKNVRYDRAMKTQRTYNLSEGSVATVKRLVDVHRIAPTQDALVERAIRELDRSVRDAEHAKLWAKAANDPEFQEESRVLDELFAADDQAAWQP